MEWIPITKQSKRLEYKKPFHNQEILISLNYWDDKTHRQVKKVQSDVFCIRNFVMEYSNKDPFYLKSGIPLDYVSAWMPMPDPYECNETFTELAFRGIRRRRKL